MGRLAGFKYREIVINFHLPRLDKLAETTHRSKPFPAAESGREFSKLNKWRIGEIKAGIKEADAGDFASDQEIQAVFKKWEINRDY